MEDRKITKQIEVNSRLDFSKIAFVMALVSVVGVGFFHYEAMQEAAKFSTYMNGSVRITVVNAINEGSVNDFDNFIVLRNTMIVLTLAFAAMSYAFKKTAHKIQRK